MFFFKNYQKGQKSIAKFSNKASNFKKLKELKDGVGDIIIFP